MLETVTAARFALPHIVVDLAMDISPDPAAEVRRLLDPLVRTF